MISAVSPASCWKLPPHNVPVLAGLHMGTHCLMTERRGGNGSRGMKFWGAVMVPVELLVLGKYTHSTKIRTGLDQCLVSL